MSSKFGWNRRTFLSALAAVTGGFVAPPESGAAAAFVKKHKLPKDSVDSSPIVPIKTGLGSTATTTPSLVSCRSSTSMERSR